ncbi:MAG TPA: TonB-dependent receptor, partial [Methylomirabilota bacterium]|nr:TonB-dependent receptor [Methylomirabilota bacterium]
MQKKKGASRQTTDVVGPGRKLEMFNPAAFALACAICSTAQGQETNKPTRLEDVVVHGRDDSLIGIADSATQGTVGARQLAHRPMLRSGEILETVPGVIITQHAGGGKANQYFLRGFNLDHGTDFYTTIDGMPLNLPSHGHGQGYMDMNIVIPELVQRVNYEKGVYYAANGDFASAGAAHLETFRVLPQSFATLEGGMYGYGRAVFGTSPKLGDGNLLIGGEAYHHDGPWENPDDYQKFNGLISYNVGDTANGYSITARAYHGKWDSSDQVASSAIRRHLSSFYDSLDDTTGGDSQRYSLQAEWHRSGERSATKVMAYGFYYDLDLFSNFTYFLTDTNRGDQFEQKDRRWTAGLNASHTLFGQLAGREMENTLGLQVRNDTIRNGLFQTEARRRVNKLTYDEFGTPMPLSATTRRDDILETSVGIYYENKVQWAEKFRTVAGLRGDFYNFDVDSINDANSGDRADAIASPKLSIIFGPWKET